MREGERKEMSEQGVKEGGREVGAGGKVSSKITNREVHVRSWG